MFANAENEEKKFEFYELLSDVSRMKIIEKMQADDRCRFTRCSKSSQKEAKSSKNYIHGLHFHVVTEQCATISISYDKFHESEPNYKGFTWTFRQNNRNIYKAYTTRRGNLLNAELWREDMEYYIDVVEYATEMFKDLLQDYQNTIKSLSFVGAAFTGRLRDYDFDIMSLNNLESLRIESIMDIPQYLLMLQRPLKSITVEGGHDESFLAEREEIYEITESVVMPGIKFFYDQMLRLQAPIFSLPFGYITEIEICHFINCWQNGTPEKPVTNCLWNSAQKSHFSIPKLLGLLGLRGDFRPALRSDPNPPQLKHFRFVINHLGDDRLKGVLSCNNRFEQLLFEVAYVREEEE